MRTRLQPLAWGFGIGVGAAVGIALGPRALGWGACFASVVTALLLSLGAWKERDDERQEITHLLRFTLGAALGFLGVHVPLTWMGLDALLEHAPGDPEVAREVASMRAALGPRWLVFALALPAGALTLWLRRGSAHEP